MEIKRDFLLTRDMVPISYADADIACCGFICPLPKDYEKYLTENMCIIKSDVEWFVAQINDRALHQVEPFENILIEYMERTEEQQLELLKGFRIERIWFDDRGLFAVQAGNNVNSGDIYLGQEESHSMCMPVSFGFKKYFDDKHAFYCHNVDFYWQALLTRELVVKYFNYLNSFIEPKEGAPIPPKVKTLGILGGIL